MAFIHTFVESHSDQASRPIGEIAKLHLVNPRPDNPSVPAKSEFAFVSPIGGPRTGPGLAQLNSGTRLKLNMADISSGYLYADQPEVTVFLRKKQWRGEEWTYTAHNETERSGKSLQISVRSLLSRIITRKIEWMGMHEHFTAVQDALSALQGIIPAEAPEGTEYAKLVGDSNVTELAKEVANVLLPTEFAPGASERGPVTRYYVQPGTEDNSYRFNGIIELNNVSNVSTNVSVSGDGSANITIENPGNIFYISSDDIDLAMSEDPYLERGDLAGNHYDYTPEQREGTLGNLVYFRGRYYTASALNAFFGITPDMSAEEAEDQVNRAKDLTPIAVSDDEKENEKLRALLRKHFLGKYVFEVFDHVWIWLTSPSKTIFSVPLHEKNMDRTIQVMESPDRGPIAELQQIEKRLRDADSGGPNSLTAEQKEKLRKRKEKIIDQLKGLKTTEIQQNTIGSAVEFQRYEESLKTGQPIDGTFPGMQEQQYQAFEGIILNVTESYSDGKYQLQLSCKDVMHYLSVSRIMIKPSLRGTEAQAPKGFLNNPVWRHNDLPEDPEAIGQWKSGLFVTYDEFLFGNVAENQNKQNIFDSPGAKSKTPLSEGAANHGVFLSTQPFAGVDAANVISFLVTGIPYNFDTFLRSGLEFGRLFVTQESGADAAPGATDGYFAMLRRQVSGMAKEKGQNEHLGNFKPYTTILGDIESTTEVLEADRKILDDKKAGLITAFNGLTNLSDEERRVLIDTVTSEQIVSTLIEHGGVSNNWTDKEPPESGKIPLSLKPSVTEYDNAVKRVLGLGDFYNYKPQQDAIKRVQEQEAAEGGSSESMIKNAISANPLEATRAAIIANRDENLLVIDAAYSANVNVQAFNRELASSQSAFSLWQSEYDTPLTTCQKAAESIDFEFFANSQGNLIFKPPTYNRVLREHLTETLNVDPILRPVLMARYSGGNGRKLEDLIRKNSLLEGALDNYTNVLRRLRAQNVAKFASLAHPDRAQPPDAIKEDKVSVSAVSTGIDPTEQDSTEGRPQGINAARLKSILDDAQQQIARITQESTLSSEQQYEKSVQMNVGMALRLETLLGNDAEPGVAAAVRTQRYIVEDLLQKDPATAVIVDENRIHIIADGDIINSSFTEQPPKFTRLDVQGQPDLVNLSEAGETYYWAGGVDYDLWRSYGFLQDSKTKPQFHSGPACAPYCRALLGRQWGKIFTGSMTVRGDSKYRLGDCIFVEGRDMYYYIEGIQNSFTYGSSYTTSLTLSYGRRRGWYIPHPFDTLGELMSGEEINLYEKHKQRNIGGELTNIPESVAETNAAATSSSTATPAAGGEVTTNDNKAIIDARAITSSLIDNSSITGNVELQFRSGVAIAFKDVVKADDITETYLKNVVREYSTAAKQYVLEEASEAENIRRQAKALVASAVTTYTPSDSNVATFRFDT